MPIAPTYPGVYIEEIPSGVRTITGVATSITAFIGRAARGPVNEALTINGFADFERILGGLWLESKLGYAVRDFYLNGGSQAIVVRLYHPEFKEDDRAKVTAAAKEVADEAKSGTNGQDAKTKAKTKKDAIEGDNQKSKEEKEAAKIVFNGVLQVNNDATPADVAGVADAAVARATPYPKAKLPVGNLKLEAADEGKWGANLRARIDVENIPSANADRFNLTIRDLAVGGATERFLNLSIEDGNPRRFDKVLKDQSKLVRARDTAPDLIAIRAALKAFEDASPEVKAEKQDEVWKLTQDPVTIAESKYLRAKAARERAEIEASPKLEELKKAAEAARLDFENSGKAQSDVVSDGLPLTVSDFLPTGGKTAKKGLFALEQADIFNLICIPPYKDRDQEDVDQNLIAAVAAYCEERRAFLLVDPRPSWDTTSAVKDAIKDADANVGTRSRNAAIFFPRLKQPNPLRDNQIEEFVPCGTVAGIFARTDTQRGVWKAPAGLDANLVGVPQLKVNLTDPENGELNPLGVNCLRSFPVYGRVVWGSRTLRGADQLADEWKYIPVRRTALFIEESLYRGTQWVVFEPNDEPLWAQIRLNIGAFMQNLFRQGAFQGKTPREAYFVKCDKETTTQTDINLGIVNIIVGFAPLKPAEFVIIKLQQMAGQIPT